MTEGAPREELPWATLSPETFARAKAERKYIVLDGSAEWCHWCHVMEATTYHDPEVRKILDKHFIAVKVDVDSRPDVEERYGETLRQPDSIVELANRQKTNIPSQLGLRHFNFNRFFREEIQDKRKHTL